MQEKKPIEATQKAIAVMTALLDGTAGGNWDLANSLVVEYGSDDASASELVTGLVNLSMVLINQVKLLTEESTEGVLSKTAQVIAEMGYDDQ